METWNFLRQASPRAPPGAQESFVGKLASLSARFGFAIKSYLIGSLKNILHYAAEAGVRPKHPRRWFEEILNCMPIGVLLSDPRTGATFFANQEFKRLFGFNTSDGRAGQDPATPDKQLAWTELRATLRACGNKLKNHEMTWHREQDDLSILVQGEALKSMHGHPPATLLCFADISEQKRVAAALKASEERFRLLAQAMPQIVWAATPDGRADYFNDRWYQFTGLNREESIGLGWQVVVHPDDFPAFIERFCAAAQSGEIFSTEERKRKHDGTYAWHLTRGVPVRNQAGDVVLIVGTCTDIQAQKETENKLRESQELRNRFTNALTHDLRNPLSAAAMAAQMLLKYELTQEAKERMCLKLVEALGRADRMISDLLDANRIQAGKPITLKVELTDLNGLVTHTLEDLSLTHGPRFRFEAEELVEGYWSPEDLRRLLENLLTNAVKYGAEQAPITVSLRRAGTSVELTVHNWGRALPEEERAGLFDIFSRSKSAEEGDQRGWGIGLTLVKGIAEAHNGSVGVESSADKGTTFSVTLPADARGARGCEARKEAALSATA